MPKTPIERSLAAVAELFGDRLESRQIAAVEAARAAGATWPQLAVAMGKSHRARAQAWYAARATRSEPE